MTQLAHPVAMMEADPSSVDEIIPDTYSAAFAAVWAFDEELVAQMEHTIEEKKVQQDKQSGLIEEESHG